MKDPDFFLASTEGYGMEAPHACKIIRSFRSSKGRHLLLVRIDPPLMGQKYGLGTYDLDTIIVAARFEGDTIDPISEWPFYVQVARLLVDRSDNAEVLHDGEFKVIGWAELYKTEMDAKNKTI